MTLSQVTDRYAAITGERMDKASLCRKLNGQQALRTEEAEALARVFTVNLIVAGQGHA